jgi:hypothetical protein
MVNETSLFAIYAEAEGHARPLIQLDLSFARLMDDIVVPYQSEQPFFIDGVPVGSNLNPTLTQLAKTRRAVFVEGMDFQLLSIFARTRGMQRLANRADFAVVQIDGFNPRRAIDLALGVEKAIGAKVLRAMILDRDYRSDDELADVRAELSKQGFEVHIHRRKEIENYLLVPEAIQRALEARLKEKARRTGEAQLESADIQPTLNACMDQCRHDVFAQRAAKHSEYKRRTSPHIDQATLNAESSRDFERRWLEPDGREGLVPGKDVLAQVNQVLQATYGVSVTDLQIASQFPKSKVPVDVVELLEALHRFGKTDPPEH